MIGFNVLNMALGAIGTTTVTWKSYKGRSKNGMGQFISSYADPTPIVGSWQPVDARTIYNLGLDATAHYQNFYTSHPIDGINRGSGSDRIEYGGKAYDVVGGADWYDQNGWRGIMCVYVGEVG